MRIRPHRKPAARATPRQARAETLESRLHPAAAPPAAPTSLAAGHAGPGEIRLAWTDRSADETGFVVGRRRGSESTFTELAVLPADTKAYLDVPDPVLFPAGTVLQYQVFAFNDAGASSPSTTFSGVTVGGAGGTGLRQRIWNDLDPATFEPLGAPAVDAVDPWVNHAWGDGPPAVGIDPDTFAVEWVGEIVAEQTKAYDFSVIANDGVRLFLEDKLVIAGGWRDQPDTEYFSEPLLLTAGQKVKIHLQSYDNTGPATVQLRWNGSINNSREAIPSAFLFPTVAPIDPVNNVPLRPITFPEVFALPATTTTPMSVGVHWQDNAFGETAYDIERATNAAFTQNKARFISPRGDHFTDRGGPDADGNPAPLEPATLYYYRIRPIGATSFVLAGNARPDNRGGFDPDVTLQSFSSPEMVTLNGYASTTAEGTIKLTHFQNDRIGSAFINRAFDVDDRFRSVAFNFRIGESNGGEGMAFVIHNAAPASPDQTQLNALGEGGGRLGYGGIPNSVAIVFDVHQALDTLGVWVNGATPPAGPITAYGDALRTDPQNTIANPNGSFDLRDTFNLTPGTAPINLDNGIVYRLTIEYNDKGVDADGNGAGTDLDTGLMTIRLSEASDFSGKAMFTARFNIDLATTVGGETAVMGWTAATGGLNSRTEVYRFDYDDGWIVDNFPTIDEIFVRGSDWFSPGGSPTPFTQHLEAKGWGDDRYGYRVYDRHQSVIPPANNPDNILPWINMNQLVVRFSGAVELPPPGTFTLRGLNPAASSYSATSVNPVAGDPLAFVLTLNRPLGGGNPTTGVAPSFDENGDSITLSVPGGDVSGSNFSLTMHVLQGDTDHLDESSSTHAVLARDFAEVKKRFFKDTTSPVLNDGADYTPFHDVDGSGQILARDFAEVKKRFFQDLPAPPTSPSTAAAAVPPSFGDRRLCPVARPGLRDLLA